MRWFSVPKVKLPKKRSSFDKSVPAYEDVLLEVERRKLEKLNKEKSKKKSNGS